MQVQLRLFGKVGLTILQRWLLLANSHSEVPHVVCFFLLLNCRPMTQSGRPLSGFVRPSTQSGRPGTMEQAIKTPRTASTARPVTSASGRFIRLGTVSQTLQRKCFTVA